MSEVNGHFVWYDLMARDPKGAEDFYQKVIGWSYTDYPMENMTYRMIKPGEEHIGGIVGLEQQEVPAHWLSYIQVPDVDEACKRASEMGGHVSHPPTDIPEVGRFAVVTDPQGGTFSPFTPLKSGESVPEGNGTVAWRELITSDPEAARDFYANLIGWEQDQMKIGDDDYVMFKSGGNFIGGLIMKPIPREQAQPLWIPYFQVEDVDDACKTAEENGGRIQYQPTDIPDIGRFAIMADPDGATFAVFTPEKKDN